MDGPFPNTDAYQYGFARHSGVRIRDISQSSLSMKFTVDFLNKLPSTFLGGNGASGNMFDVVPKKDIDLRMLYLHLNDVGSFIVEVWTRIGTHVSYETRPWLWQRRVVKIVEGKGRGKRTKLDVGSIRLNADTRYAFYIIIMESKFRYTNGVGVGEIAASNDDLTLYEGVGLSAPFRNVFEPRVWNGDFFYDVISDTPSRRLTTHFDGGSGQDGIMFDVLAYQDINITAFDLHIYDLEEVGVRIYTKKGSFDMSGQLCDDWKLVGDFEVEGKGMNAATKVTLGSEDSVGVKSLQVQSFYITVTNGTGLRYSPGTGTGNLVESNDHLAILEGIGVTFPCNSTFQDRVFNGALHYDVDA